MAHRLALPLYCLVQALVSLGISGPCPLAADDSPDQPWRSEQLSGSAVHPAGLWWCLSVAV